MEVLDLMVDSHARQHKPSSQEEPWVHPGLAPTAATALRVEAALATGLTIPEVAGAVGTSPPAVRDWQQGAQPRPAARQRLDDLRRVLLILALAGEGEGASGEWMRSRLLERNRRPLDVIGTNPIEILAAAEETRRRAEADDRPEPLGAIAFSGGSAAGGTRRGEERGARKRSG